MCIRLLSRGPLDQISGGFLYNRYLIEFLREAGADVAYHGVPPDPRSLRASDILIVDSLVVGEMAARLLTSPAEIVLLLHVLPDMAEPGSTGRALFETLCRRSQLIVTGDSTLTLLRRQIADPTLAAVTIEPGVPDYWRAKGRYAPSARSLLGIANYVRGKGLLRMIDVLCELRGLPWTLTLHGNDELDPAYFDAVARRVEARGLTERVELAGPIPHAAVNAKMLESDLLVHFSARESYSMVTAEAIVAGLPVLSHRTGNWAEFERSGLVQYVDADLVAEAGALRALIEDAGTYGQLRPASVQRTRTFEDVGREFLACLGRV